MLENLLTFFAFAVVVMVGAIVLEMVIRVVEPYLRDED